MRSLVRARIVSAMTNTSITNTVITTTFDIHGMTCEHCARAVTAEVSTLPGLRDVRVDLAAANVTVTSTSPVDRAALAAAVGEAGYELAP